MRWGRSLKSFASPEDAVKALVEALKVNDTKVLSDLFGPGSEDLVSSGDPVADQGRRKQFVHFYELKHRLDKVSADKVFLNIGDDDWPFPIPVVKTDGGWRFNANGGREEILARRIGRNELSAIQVCLAYVDAQREYAVKDRDVDGLLEYAQQSEATPGRKTDSIGRKRNSKSKVHWGLSWSQRGQPVTASLHQAVSRLPFMATITGY